MARSWESSVCLAEELSKAFYASLISVFTCLRKRKFVKDAETLLRGSQQKDKRQCNAFRNGNLFVYIYIFIKKINSWKEVKNRSRLSRVHVKSPPWESPLGVKPYGTWSHFEYCLALSGTSWAEVSSNLLVSHESKIYTLHQPYCSCCGFEYYVKFFVTQTNSKLYCAHAANSDFVYFFPFW